jgi:hypothetical protein
MPGARFSTPGMTTAFENHDHAGKRTKLIKSDDADPSGVLYVGDGCMGQSPRAVDQAGRYYLERADSVRNYWHVELPGDCVAGQEAIYRNINQEGVIYDTYSKREDPTAAPPLSRPALHGSTSTTARTRARRGASPRSTTRPGPRAMRNWAMGTRRRPRSRTAQTPTTSTRPPTSAIPSAWPRHRSMAACACASSATTAASCT